MPKGDENIRFLKLTEFIFTWKESMEMAAEDMLMHGVSQRL